MGSARQVLIVAVIFVTAVACQSGRSDGPGDSHWVCDAVELGNADSTSMDSGDAGSSGYAPPSCDHPWQMPTAGGECVVVGPRLCLPEGAEGQCAEGLPSECVDGLALNDDATACVPHFDDDCGEFEIPGLGGGCRQVGPRWDEIGGAEPHFDYCPLGELALPGGGCAKVGPRACAAVWDKEDTSGCMPDDWAECPEGWAENEDGLYCEPVYDDCGPGHRPLLGGGCAMALVTKATCEEATFAAEPAAASPVVYASAKSACQVACGTIDAPFSSLQLGVVCL